VDSISPEICPDRSRHPARFPDVHSTASARRHLLNRHTGAGIAWRARPALPSGTGPTL